MFYFEENIIYSDNHIIIALKSPGLLSQKDKTGDDSILEHIKRYVKVRYHKPGAVFLGSVHRLDRPASGLMVFAKTSKALKRLNESMKAGEIKKEYLAIVEGVPAKKSAKLIHYLEKNHLTNSVKLFFDDGPKRKKAVLSYTIRAHHEGRSLLDIVLETGRPHQIRAQLSSIGCPVIGDYKYGAKIKTGDRSICLMSYQLELVHPVLREAMKFKAQYPYDKQFWKSFVENID